MRAGSIMANVSFVNMDNVSHTFVVIVGGTDPAVGFPLVGTGTITVPANQTTNVSVPVLVTVPASANTGSYNLFAGLYNFDSGVLSPSNLVGNIVGPEVSIVS
jgi:hypothetical protein